MLIQCFMVQRSIMLVTESNSEFFRFLVLYAFVVIRGVYVLVYLFGFDDVRYDYTIEDIKKLSAKLSVLDKVNKPLKVLSFFWLNLFIIIH